MNITTKSTKANREVTVVAPTVLTLSTIKELVDSLGEDLAIAKIKAQLTIDFRSAQRTLIESTDDNNDPTHSDEAIAAMDFSDWKPELRVRQSPEEKAAKLLSTLSPDQIRAAIAASQGIKDASAEVATEETPA